MPGIILLNWLLLFPFTAAAVIAAFPRILRWLPAHERPAASGAPAATAITASALSLGVCIALGAIVARSGDVYADYLWTPDFFQFRLRLDPLGVYALLAILTALLLTELWAAGAGDLDHRQWAGLAAAAGAFTGVVLAADLVLLYISWELAALALWVALAPPLPEGKRFLAWSHAGGACILVGVLLISVLARDTHIYTAGLGLLIHEVTALKAVGVVLIIGLAIKLALAPLHWWLPSAARAGRDGWDLALLGVALLVAAYAAIRLIFFILPGYAAVSIAWLPITLGLITVAYAGVRALLTDDSRRGVSHLLVVGAGQIALCIGVAMLGRADALAGAIALLAVLAVAIPLLAAGTDGPRHPRRDPAAAPTAGIALLGGAWTLAAVPPLAGFWAERMLVRAAWQVNPGLGLAALLAPAVLLVYGIKAASTRFASEAPRGSAPQPGPRLWWVLVTVAISLILGVMPWVWMPFVGRLAHKLAGG